MAKYLDPKTDVTFKKVFGEHKDILISFLNSMLPLPAGTEIRSLEYLSPELLPKTPEGKDSIVDVRCMDGDGRTFIVEMQMYWTNAFKKRALFNACKAYSYPAEKGGNFNDLKPVYALSLVNETAFPEYPDDFYHIFTLVHDKYSELKIDEIVMVFVELPKFRPQCVTDRKLMSLWLRFLTEVNDKTQQVSADLASETCISKALSLVEESAYSQAELMAIDSYWDWVSRGRTLLSGKEEEGRLYGLKEGRAEGLAEGRAEGLAEGRAEGLAEGRAEGMSAAKTELAKAMMAEGIEMSVIIKVCGLSESQLSELQES